MIKYILLFFPFFAFGVEVDYDSIIADFNPISASCKLHKKEWLLISRFDQVTMITYFPQNPKINKRLNIRPKNKPIKQILIFKNGYYFKSKECCCFPLDEGGYAWQFEYGDLYKRNGHTYVIGCTCILGRPSRQHDQYYYYMVK